MLSELPWHVVGRRIGPLPAAITSAVLGPCFNRDVFSKYNVPWMFNDLLERFRLRLTELREATAHGKPIWKAIQPPVKFYARLNCPPPITAVCDKYFSRIYACYEWWNCYSCYGRAIIQEPFRRASAFLFPPQQKTRDDVSLLFMTYHCTHESANCGVEKWVQAEERRSEHDILKKDLITRYRCDYLGGFVYVMVYFDEAGRFHTLRRCMFILRRGLKWPLRFYPEHTAHDLIEMPISRELLARQIARHFRYPRQLLDSPARLAATALAFREAAKNRGYSYYGVMTEAAVRRLSHYKDPKDEMRAQLDYDLLREEVFPPESRSGRYTHR